MEKEPRGKFDKTKIVILGEVEISDDEHARALQQIAIADEEYRTGFRGCESVSPSTKRKLDD